MRAYDLTVSGSLYITGSIKTADGTFMLSGSTTIGDKNGNNT